MKCLREKGQGPRIDQYFLRSQSSQSNEIQRQEANHSSQDISTPVIDVRRTCMDTVSDEPNDPCEPVNLIVLHPNRHVYLLLWNSVQHQQVGIARLDARCTHLDARRLGARRYTRRRLHLDAQRFGARRLDARCTHLDARRLGVRRYTRRRLDARCTHLDARRFGASTLGACTSTLGARCLDARCTRLDARCSHLDARRFGASTLGARTSTLNASAHAPRHFDARCTHLDARRFGASTLGARTSTLDASAHRRSVHAPRRSTLRRIDARCTHLDARRFGA
ncbi:UNVERIFIED_CONTAM: hypothetical protein FKN15_014928 [Acipenser sinensis]